MVKKAAHPESELFEYLNGSLHRDTAQVIETHLSECDDCASVARLVHELKEPALQLGDKSQLSNQKFHPTGEHPDLRELASFFYARSRRAEHSCVAAHVALCSACGEAIAQYARGERSAAEYNPASAPAGQVPANAWEMIRDWEDSSFAKPKLASEVLGQDLLTRLAGILNEQGERARERDASAPQDAERVPVLIVSRSGEVHGVEFFERRVDSTGVYVLRHPGGSGRFDNKPLLSLFGFGEKESFVVSNPIRRDTIRLEKAPPEGDSLRADYIIIED
jgi:hypothetical protein